MDVARGIYSSRFAQDLGKSGLGVEDVPGDDTANNLVIGMGDWLLDKPYPLNADADRQRIGAILKGSSEVIRDDPHCLPYP